MTTKPEIRVADRTTIAWLNATAEAMPHFEVDPLDCYVHTAHLAGFRLVNQHVSEGGESETAIYRKGNVLVNLWLAAGGGPIGFDDQIND